MVDLSQFSFAPLPPEPTKGWLTSGLKSGYYGGLSSIGGGLEAVGQAAGWRGLQDFGQGVAESNAQQAEAVGRPDLEGSVFDKSLSQLPAFAGYQVAKSIPYLAGLGGAALAGAAAAPAAPALGGAAAMGLAGYLPAVGDIRESQRASAKAQGRALNQRDAENALMAGIPYSALNMLEIGALAKAGKPIFGAGASTAVKAAEEGGQGVLKGALQGMGLTGAAAAVQGAAQTGIASGFRDDLSTMDKMHSVVDAAVTGGLVGGLIGAPIGGFRGLKGREPARIPNEDLAGEVDKVLALPSPDQFPVYVDPTGRAGRDLNEVRDFGPAGRQMAGEQAATAGLDVARAGLEGQPLALPDPRNVPPFDQPIPVTPEGQGIAPTPEPTVEQARAAREAEVVQRRNAEDAARAQSELPPPPEGPVNGPDRQQAFLASMQEAVAGTSGGKQAITKAVRDGGVTDEPSLYNWVANKLEATDKWPGYLQRLGERVGLIDAEGQPRNLQAELTTAIDALKKAKDPTEANTLRQQIGDIQSKLELQKQAESRKLENRPTEEPAKPAEAPPAAPQEAAPFNTLMAERLTPAKRQLELDAARRQAEEQTARQREAETPDTKVQAAENTPTKFDAEAFPVGDVQRRKTVAVLNALSPEEQTRLLARADFTNGGRDPVKAVMDLIAGQKAQSQARLREALVKAAGAAEETAQAKAARDVPKRPVPASEKVIRPDDTRGVQPGPVEAPVVRETPVVQPRPTAEAGAALARQAARDAVKKAEPKAETPRPVSELLAKEEIARRDAERAKASSEPLPARDKVEAQEPKLTPEQERTRLIRNRINDYEMAGNADPGTVRELKRMVDEGKPVEQIAKKLNEATEGKPSTTAERSVAQSAANAPSLSTQDRVKATQMIRKGDIAGAIDHIRKVQAKQGRNIAGEFDPVLKKQVETLARAKAPPEIIASFVEDAFNANQPRTGYDLRGSALSEPVERNIEYLSKYFSNIRNTDTPKWFDGLQKTVNALSEKLGLEAPRLWVGDGADANGFAINGRDLILRSDMGRVKAVSVAMHELGHAVEHQLLDRAPENVRRMIAEAFRRDTGLSDKTLGQLKPLTSAGDNGRTTITRGYETSFPEWFAEQVSRWLTTDAKPTSVVDKFFAKIADVWRAIYREVTGHVPLADEVRAFMDGAWRDDKMVRRGEPTADTIRFDKPPKNAREISDTANMAGRLAASVASRFDLKDLGAKVRDKYLWASTLGNMIDVYGKDFKSKGLDDYFRIQQGRSGIEQRGSQTVMSPMNKWERMVNSGKTGKELGALIEKMATYYPALRIDPRRGWDAQPWLHDQPNSMALQRRVVEANKEYQRLKQTNLKNDGLDFKAADIYHEMIDNQTGLFVQKMAMDLDGLVRNNKLYAEALGTKGTDSLIKRFMQTADSEQTPKAYHDYWRKELNTLLSKAEAYIKDQTKDVKDASTKSRDVNALYVEVKNIKDKLAKLEQEPYFHLGRRGEFFAGFKMALGADKKVLPDTVEKLAAAFEKAGITGVEIPRDTTNPSVFIRSERLGESQRIADLARELAKQGLVDEKSIINGKRSEVERQNSQSAHLQEMLTYLQTLRDEGDGLGGDKNARKQAYSDLVRQLQDFNNEMLSDTSEYRLLLRREYVPGYSTDAIHNYAFRTRAAMHAIANLAMAFETRDARAKMMEDVKAAQGGSDLAKTTRMQQVYDEVLAREAERGGRAPSSFVGMVRAINHSYFLGFSPAYALVQATQVPVLAIPELAKVHGFVNSSKAAIKVMGTATKILAAAFSEARNDGWKGTPDIHLTEKVLKEAGLNDQQRATVLRLVNEGAIELGAASRQLGRLVEGRENSALDLATRYASMAGLYSETWSRLITGLAAHELYNQKPVKGMSAHDYAMQTIQQSMFTFNQWNQSRALGSGKSAILGGYTPIASAFMSYQVMALEKLFREFHGVMAGENKAQSAKFLAAHLGAVTALAGTLGLPFVNMFASLYDRLSDLFTDEKNQPSDIKASWRNFLSDTFGQDMGEVLSRGIPRIAGADISNRVGEQDILPFTKFIADRRKWDDSLKDMALGTLGSPVSMVSNIYKGGEKMAQGDILGGMREGLPIAFRNLANTYALSTEGYRDAKGSKLPIEPGASDIVNQIMGFKPAQKAEYDEARMNEANRKSILTREAQNIRNGIAKALEMGENDDARDWLKKAKEFDKAHPDMAITPRLQATLMQRARARALAGSLGTPLGVNPRDVGASARDRFANY